MNQLLNPVEPQVRHWSRAEFYQLAEQGYFQGQRAELIEGEIMVMSPQKAEHFTTLERVTEVLRNLFGEGVHVRMQGPLELGPHSEPEPDVAVVAGKREDYATQHPRTALLIVEVSDTTLMFDRTGKASLYARAGIEDYWIVNLVDLQVEVYRQPQPDATQRYGHHYASIWTLTDADHLNPLAAPAVTVAVAALLP